MKKKLYNHFSMQMMRGFVLGLLSLVFTLEAQAQVAADGDYRTAKVTGNWSDADMWQTRAAGAWALTATAPTASNNVYIQEGHTVTVDVEATCLDLHINALGVLAISGSTNANVNGKIRCFTGAADVSGVDGTYLGTSSTMTVGTMITTPSTGVLKFVGVTRDITKVGEWNSSNTNNAVEFALNSGATGTLLTGIKFKPIIFSSGIITTGFFISAVNGNVRIKNGARLISSRSGLTGEVIGNLSTTPAGTVTIDLGGILELTGTTPAISCTEFINNGIVIYSKGGAQTWLQLGTTTTTPGTGVFNSYSTVVLTGSGGKTLSTATTVNSLLQFTGTANVVPTATLTLTMANGSTIEKGSTTNPTTIISTANSAFVNLGTDPSHLVNLLISASNTNSGELAATPAVPVTGKIGTLTINTGVTYTITGGRYVTNVLNNGIVALRPGTTMALTIGGSISGSGTFSSNLSTGNVAATPSTPEYYSASLVFTGTAPVTLNMTPGANEIRNLTVNNVGGLTLGNSLKLNNTLTLTAGTLTTGGNLTLNGAMNVARGAGTIIGDLTLPATATISPGASPGTMTITGNLNSAANYTVELGGTTAGTGYDQVVVSGTATLSGGIATVSLIADPTTLIPYDPPSGSTFVILTAGSLSGTFPTINLPALTGGKTWQTTYSATSLTLTVSGGLPVELVSFDARKNQNSVLLSWTTASEKDNAYFDVEYSGNGNEFQTIGQVKGNGTSVVSNTYKFEHKTPSVGINYYRLKQVDYNGTSNYSPIRSVIMGKSGFALQSTLVHDVLNVVSSDETSTPLSIFNVSGQQVFTGKVQGAQQINISALPSGLYIIRSETGDVARFVKSL
jgi:trimeric autotransporter adhesin